MKFPCSILRVTLLLLVLLVALPQAAQAQLHHIETILESDGLPSPDVKSIAQDRWGLIWIASRGGITFHNGLIWAEVDLDSLSSSTSDGLLGIGAEGNVWALLSGNDPALLRHGFCNWESIPLPAGMAKSRCDFKYFALNAVDDQTVAAIIQYPNQMHVSSPDGWSKIPLEEKGIIRVTAMVSMDDKFILASPQGVFSVSAAAPHFIQPLFEHPTPNPALSLCLNRLDNSLWMVGDDWIGKIDQEKFELLLEAQDQPFVCFSDPYTKVCQTDGFGGIYLSGIFSTQYFHPQTGMEKRGPKNGFWEFGTTDFFLDRELVMWQGTTQGIHKVLSRHAKGFNKSQGLLADEVTALLYRRDGTKIIGHSNGLTLLNDQMTPLAFADNDLRDRVLDLAEDSKGNVWIAGRRKGLGKLSPDGSLQWWPLGQELQNYTSSVLVDDHDRVWISASKNILIMENGKFTKFPLESHIQERPYLRRLIKGNDGTIYIATGNLGLMAVKGKQFSHWKTGLKDHGNSIYDVLETLDGITWVGTRNGLYQLSGDRLVRPTESRYNFDRPVYFLESDHQDRLWLGTDNGVIRIDGDEVKHFTAEIGVIGRETNRCASLLDPEGKFWMGTERGLTIFNDLFENTSPQPPLVYLVQLESGGEKHSLVREPGEITLPARATNIVFHYRVFSTSESKRMKVLYKLDGLDDDWVESSSSGEQVFRYTHVPPGIYQFHIKAAGYNQPWSVVASSPEITVPAPVWQRTWFLILIGLAVFAVLALPIIFVAQRRYTNRLQREVEVQVAANLRIEAELEQARNLKALGLLAGGIAHDFNNLLTIIFGNLSLLKIDENLKPIQQKRLGTATGAIERARGLTNQLLTFSQGGAPILEIGSLANLVRESADFVLRGSNIKCQFELPENLWPVVMDPGQMSQVVNNLLMNAQEAMPQGGLIILKGRNLETAPGGIAPGIYVEITVTDNGPGIKPDVLPKIFDPYFSTKEQGSGLGLATAFSILDRHEGRLTVESILDRSTTFKLLIPASDRPVKSEPSGDPDILEPLQGTVLLLDDDPEVRSSLGLMLKSLGLNVEDASEGRLALDQYRKMLDKGHAPDIVLTDLTIPGGMGGLEIIIPLLRMDPDAKAIVISGYSHNPVISEYHKYGFKAAIAKPILVEELGRVLRKVLADESGLV